jgi:hypothetical protein
MNQFASKWANTEPDAGSPHALLERLGRNLPSTAIEDIWLFPTRPVAAGESTVFVVAAITDDPERRRVITARYTVTRDRKGVATVQEQLDEHGTAPAAAVARIVQGVLQRMGEEGEQPPRAERIGRDAERWWALFEELGGHRPQPDPETTEASPGPPVPDRPETSPGASADASARIDGESGTGYQ